MMESLKTNRNIDLSVIRQKLKAEQRKILFKNILKNRMMITGGVIFILLLLLATFGPMFMKYTPYEMTVSDRLAPPSSEHIMGTDNFGRDILTRIVSGARAT